MPEKNILALGSGMVAKPCVDYRLRDKNNVLTIDSPAIHELEYQANAAGITVLNEVGVDPGVDPLYTIKTIGEVHKKDEGSDIVSLVLSVLTCLGWLDTGSKAWLKEGTMWSPIQQQLTGATFAPEVDSLAKVDEICNSRPPPEERSKILAGLK
ncbi:Saccharopine dehydrogenase [Fusarium agapanthi]|uniref:Saccharopine dehydrogenase n=1 Tax=Fusarium agapanthi TaxID=1803897 RepID=A0A9P5B4R7_9HYPO|nr:Saccharopine dehydrogenase [Fusarium agapanthi]